MVRLPSERAEEPNESGMNTLLEIEYFTDPICSWSWALEPQLLRLRAALGDQAKWRLRLMGMVDGPRFSDPLQQIHQPGQWAPQWLEVAQRTGMPFDPSIWHDDPPTDSRLACLAVAAAAMQSERSGWAMLRRLRESVMVGRRNVARHEVLEEIAQALDREGLLDAKQWRHALGAEPVRHRIRNDMAQASYQQIHRFPTLLLRPGGSRRALLLVGWRPWKVLVDALADLGFDAATTPEAIASVAASITEEERQLLNLSSDDLRGWRHEVMGPTSVWRAPVTAG